MPRTTGRKHKSHGALPRKELLPKPIRKLVFAVTIPSIINGCAHQPSSQEATTASPPKRVFRVVLPEAKQETYASTLPELSDTFSSASIIRHIMLRHQAEAGKAAKKAESYRDYRGKHSPGSKTRNTMAAAAATGGIQIVSRVQSPSRGGVRIARSRGQGDHWDTVRGRMVLVGVSHELIDAHLEQLRQHPGAVDFLMKRAEPYLPYLLEEIDRNGLPTDLVLVPMVESAFEPTALSPKQAAGIWQFIPSTGQQYGLEVSDSYDGRYDVHAATQAACKYLKHLSQLFHGDWLLALAAYNAGEGAVQRAVEASRKAGEDGSFWDLDLPAETQAYVVKILSLAHAVADPSALGLKARRFSGQSHLARLQAGPEVRIPDLIALAGIAPEDFYKLNPAFKPDVEPPAVPRNIILPKDKAEVLAAKVTGIKVYGAQKVVARRGDTLARLAKRHGLPPLKLAEWNHLNPNAALKAGQELVVYPV